jgi:S1-C subfamily serine protease
MQDLKQLGITGRPSDTDPKGLLVTAFTATTPESPLKTIGVQEGDVILSCNGAAQQMGTRLPEAVKGLQERGEPMTLVVLRGGKQVTLERKEKLPTTQ